MRHVKHAKYPKSAEELLAPPRYPTTALHMYICTYVDNSTKCYGEGNTAVRFSFWLEGGDYYNHYHYHIFPSPQSKYSSIVHSSSSSSTYMYYVYISYDTTNNNTHISEKCVAFDSLAPRCYCCIIDWTTGIHSSSCISGIYTYTSVRIKVGPLKFILQQCTRILQDA